MNFDDLNHSLVERFGYKESELKNRKSEELRALYDQSNRQYLEQYKTFYQHEFLDEKESMFADDNSSRESKNVNHIWKDIIANIRDDQKLYTAIENAVRNLTMAEIDMMLESHVTDREYEKIHKRFRIKYRQYQEELLDDLGTYMADLPDEEQFNQIESAWAKRNNIKKMREIYQNLSDPIKKEIYQRLAENKIHILREYYPKSFQEEYARYTEVKVRRKELIENILNLTKMYQRDELLRKPTNELEQIESYYRELKANKRKKKTLVRKHLDKLLRMMGEDYEESDFYQAIRPMFMELGDDEIGDVLASIRVRNEDFAAKVQRSYAKRISASE